MEKKTIAKTTTVRRPTLRATADPIEDTRPDTVEEKVSKALLAKRAGKAKGKPRGPESPYRGDVHPLVAAYLRRDGADDEEVAKALGVTVGTVRKWARVHDAFGQAMKTVSLAVCESVVRALLKSALGQEFTDIERSYEVRINPVTRKREKVLTREKETKRRALPNPIACFFYLQNRDALRWQPSGAGAGKGSVFQPEQVAAMMRASGRAVSDATLGVGLAETG